jgi:LysR family transcriptional regulator, glycine cleavage system transcriptional activator
MSERVLPLRAISVFEAVARAASFHAAAHELNLTPSAVSHQIRLLEETLGVQLFDRIGRGVKLTPDGAEYARTVRQSIRRLRLATSDIKARGNKGSAPVVVRIETPPSLAHCWLLPRLPALITRHPGVEFRVNAQGQHLQGDRLPWPPVADAPADIQIVYGGDDLWEDRAARLSSERFQPYCAPALLKQQAVESPVQLLQQTLISSSQNHVAWEDWMNAQGIDIYESAVTTIQLDPSHLAIEAAVQSLGVILENGMLVERELATGRLVALFPELGVQGLSYWILIPAPRRARPAVDAVIDWLKDQAAIRCING